VRRPAHDTPEIVRSDLSQLCLACVSWESMTFSQLTGLMHHRQALLKKAELLLDRLGPRRYGSATCQLPQFLHGWHVFSLKR